jgi:fibro-slime domain-containing protein
MPAVLRLPSWTAATAVASVIASLALAQVACGSTSGGNAGADAGSGGSSGGASDAAVGGEVGSLLGDGGASGSGSGGGGGDGSALPPGTIHATIRDFRFYNALDMTTDPDFENPPYNIGEDGGASPGYQGDWDDRVIVASTIGADNKPVYAGDPTMGTLTTHGTGPAGDATKQFNAWYNDVAGTNVSGDYPLPLVHNADGSVGYDSNQQGVLYVANDPTQGKGFFPIDDGTPYATTFGNQGKPHNFSFTVEIHTVFQYMGGEYFNFRGDDDVFVFIDGKLVINLGGIHNPETAQVSVDTLGLTRGQTYPLDFFSAERHVYGSNILFQTTLNLQPINQ